METLKELLELQWTKRDGTPDDKMVEHCLKSSIYIQVGDTYIDVGDNKPKIDNQLWYDDETDGPDASQFAAFRNYNLRSHKQPMLSEVSEYGGPREIWVTTHWYNDKTGGKMLGLIVKRVDDAPRSGELRRATAEEISLANEARAKANADYEKRLATYWKRYSNKVHASGYWANR